MSLVEHLHLINCHTVPIGQVVVQFVDMLTLTVNVSLVTNRGRPSSGYHVDSVHSLAQH